MGEKYTKYNIDLDLIRRRHLPIISCIDLEDLLCYINLGHIKPINLGKELSFVLKTYPKEKRPYKIIEELNNLFIYITSIAKDYIAVGNIDILFNPNYNLNILRYFINLARKETVKVVIIEWPGKLKGDYLEYSQINYPDYARYNINNYKIVCVE